MRLFIALWPDPATRAALAGLQRAWSWPERAAVVRPEQLHLTLHFLGNVPSPVLPDLVGLLQVPCEPITLDFGTTEIWPHGIAVLRPSAIPPALLALHGALAPRVSAFGLPLDPRRYRPHVTLARRAAGAQPPPREAAIRWRADDGYVLVRSLPEGAGYEELAHFGQDSGRAGATRSLSAR